MTPARTELPSLVDDASRVPLPDGLAYRAELDALALALRAGRAEMCAAYDQRIAEVDAERHVRDGKAGAAFEAYVAARRSA